MSQIDAAWAAFIAGQLSVIWSSDVRFEGDSVYVWEDNVTREAMMIDVVNGEASLWLRAWGPDHGLTVERDLGPYTEDNLNRVWEELAMGRTGEL